MYWEHLAASISEEHPYLLVVVYDKAPLVDKTPQLGIRSLALFLIGLSQ